MMTTFFGGAIERLLTRPVDLMPARASSFRFVLFRNRIWTTKKFLSPEEWDALVRDYDERNDARLRGVVERFKEVMGKTGRIWLDGLALGGLAAEQERLRKRSPAADLKRAEVLVPVSLGHLRPRLDPEAKLIKVREADRAIAHPLD